jgi:hypothetical protein
MCRKARKSSTDHPGSRDIPEMQDFTMQFLGGFAKLGEATIFSSSCLYVRLEQLDYHWTDFNEIWYLSI